MKYALVLGNKSEAMKGLAGICPNCGEALIAKCGPLRINHWAHKGIRTCDPWWEPETQWHRNWKNEFPEDWQEKPRFDGITGEKHIADIATNQNFVVEFQHSYIQPEERIAREGFYKNMIWVVDGTRSKREYQQFLKGRSSFVGIGGVLYKVSDFEDFWPACWTGSRVPVVVDFSGDQSAPEDPSLKDVLYCLFPTRIGRYGVVAALSREILVGSIKSGKWSEWSTSIVNELELLKKEQKEKSKIFERQKTNAAFRNLMGFKRVRRRRF